jgi:hypothetical protein
MISAVNGPAGLKATWGKASQERMCTSFGAKGSMARETQIRLPDE